MLLEKVSRKGENKLPIYRLETSQVILIHDLHIKDVSRKYKQQQIYFRLKLLKLFLGQN